jgi:DNA invertase Pin-like site-specific DNA recombinase
VRVVGYVRVSTLGQANEGGGLDVQTDMIRGWCRQHRHRLIGVLEEKGVSGAREVIDRPVLAEALALIKQGRVDGIVVARLDRLARDLILQEQLLREIRRLGGQLATTMSGEAGFLADDPSDPSRRLIRQVLGAVAEYERSLIVLRLQAGRRRKADSGGYAHGAPSFGWKAAGGQLVQDSVEQEASRRAIALRLTGASLRTIAARLDEEGHRPKRGERWHPMSVSRILADEQS